MMQRLDCNPYCRLHCPRSSLLRGAGPARRLLEHKRPAVVLKRRSRGALICSAASEDPYKVLGVPRKADSDQIRRVYKKKLAEAKGNEALTKRIEDAHTSIVMSSFNSRLKGNVEVDKNVAYADRAVFFPWRPRLHLAEKKVILYIGLLHGVLALWAVLLKTTAGTQPLIASVVAGAGFNSWKLFQIFPPPPSSSEAAQNNKQGVKNIFRGIALALFATFVGCALFFTVPDAIAAQLNKVLPYWFYESESALICVGTALANFIVSACYR